MKIFDNFQSTRKLSWFPDICLWKWLLQFVLGYANFILIKAVCFEVVFSF